LQIVIEIRAACSAAGTASCRNTEFRPGGGNFGPRGGRKYQKAKCQDQNHCDQRGGLARNSNSHGATSAIATRQIGDVRSRISEAIGKNFKERLGPNSSSLKRALQLEGYRDRGQA
jgi:hypothetical protein